MSISCSLLLFPYVRCCASDPLTFVLLVEQETAFSARLCFGMLIVLILGKYQKVMAISEAGLFFLAS